MRAIFAEFAVNAKSRDLRLHNARVTNIDDLQVKVKLPDEAINSSGWRQSLATVLSRITTWVVNRSKVAMSQDISRAFLDDTKKTMVGRV